MRTFDSELKEVEEYYPPRAKAEYYRKLIASLEKRVADYKQRLKELDEQERHHRG